MGQSQSAPSPPPQPGSSQNHHQNRRPITLTSASSSSSNSYTSRSEMNNNNYIIHHNHDINIDAICNNSSSIDIEDVYVDYTSEIPDDCLGLIFQSLNPGDRNRCSLVCKRFLKVEGQSRHRLALSAQSELLQFIPRLFSRFDSVTKLSLRCDRRSVSLNDAALILISHRCVNLTRLKIRGCRELTELGMSSLGLNCKKLKKFSCGSCMFGAKGINAFLDNCSTLEELSVKRLRGVNDAGAPESVGPGAAAASLKSVYLKELYNGQFFGPLIAGAKNLKTLKLLRCLGDWDKLLEMISDNCCLTEVHLERLQVSDVGLAALSNCVNLEILHIVKTPDCSNVGVVSIAESCKYLRKLHIDGWKTNRIGNEALIAIAKHSVNLQELVLIGVNPNSVSLEAIALNCQKLERLALCGSETIADGEISCIASKCVALKKLCIKGCPVSDEGIEAFAWGCPNLVKIKVKKCRNVTGEVGDWLRARRGSLVVNLDVFAVEVETVDASASESGGAQEDVVELPPVAAAQPESLATCASGRGSVFKARFGLFGGRGLVSSAFRRWSVGNSSSSGSS